MKLIEDYDLEVFTPPCEPGAERFSAIARLTTDISEVLPYLNATLRGAVYNPSSHWRMQFRNLFDYPEDFLADIMGQQAWWSVPAAAVLGIPLYSNAGGGDPGGVRADGEGSSTGHGAGLYDVGGGPQPAGDAHFAPGIKVAIDRCLYRYRSCGDRTHRLSI